MRYTIDTVIVCLFGDAKTAVTIGNLFVKLLPLFCRLAVTFCNGFKRKFLFCARAVHNVVVQIPVGQYHVGNCQFVCNFRCAQYRAFAEGVCHATCPVNGHVLVCNGVKQHVESIDIVVYKHSRQIADKFFGGYAQSAHEGLPQTLFFVGKGFPANIQVSEHRRLVLRLFSFSCFIKLYYIVLPAFLQVILPGQGLQGSLRLTCRGMGSFALSLWTYSECRLTYNQPPSQAEA